MSSRPSSRATAGEEGTTSLRSSTARRPVTKPVAPRLSSTGTTAKLTSPSSTRTSTTATSTLHKPPSRPTTTSTVKRPPSSTATATNSLHRPRASVTSTDASADESKRNGITARPKRMSLAPTTTAQTPSTSASRTAAATPARRTPSTATPSTVRQTVRSPTSTTKTSSTSIGRTASTPTSRTKPLSSITRPVATLADKKRLSTIPASPAVKSVIPRGGENKENEVGSDTEARPVRRALGVRQPTRSVVIEQRIHEFELVNRMLRSAMIADGMDAEEEEHLEEESKNTMARLRSDLAKVRAFEKENARLPTETELADMEDMPIEGEASNAETAESKAAAGPETASLKHDLEESQAQVQELKSHLAEITARMEHFSKTAEDESVKVQEATESIRSEHESKVEHMLALHNSQIQDLEASYQRQMEDVAAKHEAELTATNEDNIKFASDKITEIEALRAELDEAKTHAEDTARARSISNVEDLAKLQKQLDAAQAEHRATKEIHAQSLKQLETQHATQMTGMQRQVDEARKYESQEEELVKEKEAHVNTQSLLASIKDELESVKQAKERNEEEHSLAARGLSEQLAALEKSKNEAATNAAASVTKIKTDQERKLKELETKLKAAESELQANVDISEHHYTEAMQKLKDDLEASQKQLTGIISERDGAFQDYESKLEAAKEEAASTQKAHEKEVLALKSQLSAINDLAKDEATRNEKEMKAVQSLLEAKDDELKGLQASQDNRLREEANSAKKAALDEQASSHQRIVSELEKTLESVQRSLDDTKKSHEEEVKQLKASHQQGSEDLVAKSKMAEDAVQDLKMSQAEEIRKLESKIKDMMSESDAAKFQTQSLKDILREVEQDFKTKEEEVQKELDSKNEDFSQAIVKLSTQSMRITELEAAHKQAVEQAKAAVQAETQASLDALKQQHDNAFDELRRDLEVKHQNTLQTMHSEHSHAIDMLTKEVNVRDHNVESMKAEHAQALADLHSSSQQAIAAAHEKLSLEHKTHIEDLQNKHATRTAEDLKQSRDLLDQTKAEHESIVATHQVEAQKLREKIADTSELESLSTQLSASQQAFTKLQEEHATAMSSISKEHAQQLGAVEEKLKALEAKADTPVDTTELDAVRSELAEERAKIAELASSHAEVLSSKDREHAGAVEALRSELSDAQAAASSAARDLGDVEQVNSLLADAQRTVQELSEQYTVASMDAEQQRLAAESAKKELSDLKQSLSEAAVLSTFTTESKEPPRAANGSSENVKASPKGGLKASKWATAEPEPTSATDAQAKDIGVYEGLSIDQAKAEQPKPKSRNVAGQAAGIQEQIRQMKEINDEALSDHQKWARTLNRVDDDGTVTVSGSQNLQTNENLDEQDGTVEPEVTT